MFAREMVGEPMPWWVGLMGFVGFGLKQLLQFFLESFDGASHFREFIDGRIDGGLFKPRDRGASQDDQVVGDVRGNSRLRTNHRTVADLGMIPHTYLSGQDYIISGAATASDADLGADQVVLADVAVVRDLNKIVDFGPSADACCAVGPSVHGAISTDFYIVFDFDPAELRCRLMMTFDHSVAETVGTQNDTSVQCHTISQNGTWVQNDSWIQLTIASDMTAWHQCYASVEMRSGPHCATVIYRHECIDEAIGMDFCCRVNACGGMDSKRTLQHMGWSKNLTDFGKCVVGVRNHDLWEFQGVERFRSDNGRRWRGLKFRDVLLIIDEGDVPWLGIRQRRGTSYHGVVMTCE